MDGTQSETKPLTRRLTSRKRLLILVGLVGLVLVSGVVVADVAIGSGGILDDFEDGNADDWELEQNNPPFRERPTVNQDKAFNGSYSAEANDGDDDYELHWTDNTAYTNHTIHVNGVFSNWGSNTINFELFQDGSDVMGAFRLDQGGNLYHANGDLTTWTDTGQDLSDDQWYVVRYENIDYTSETWDLVVYDDGLNEIHSTNGISFLDSPINHVDSQRVRLGGDGGNIDLHFDSLSINTTENVFPPEVDGYVFGEDGDPLSGATVTASQSGTQEATATTNSNGYYNYTLSNGTYNTSASLSGYITDTETLTVSGPTSQNYTLIPTSESLRLDTRRFLRHGESMPYSVTFATDRTASGNLQRRDVTDDDSNLTVSSTDSNNLSVHTSNNTLVATNDSSVNKQIRVWANYSYSGDQYNVSQLVTVANVTVDNFGILPPWGRFEATIAPGTEANPGDHSFMLIMIATMVAVAATLLASTFAGLGAFSIIIVAGWLIGMTTAGLMLVVLTVVGFAGLNLAANIDYAVT